MIVLFRSAGRSRRAGCASRWAVHWQFVGLAELVEILEPELRDGSEVLSTYSSKDAEFLTRTKDELAVFWSRANAKRTARDLLDEE